MNFTYEKSVEKMSKSMSKTKDIRAGNQLIQNISSVYDPLTIVKLTLDTGNVSTGALEISILWNKNE